MRAAPHHVLKAFVGTGIVSNTSERLRPPPLYLRTQEVYSILRAKFLTKTKQCLSAFQGLTGN